MTPPSENAAVSASASASAAAPSIEATPAVTPVPAGPIQVAWASQVFPGEILSLVGDGNRFVAVGIATEPHAAWTSTDGTTWASHPVPIASLDDHDANLADLGPDFASRWARMGQLVRLGDTVYSFGSFNFNDYVEPVGWYWTDGAAWRAVTSDSAFYEGGIPRDFIGSGDALVAARSNLGISWIGADSTVWTWRSATSWVQSDLSVGDGEPVSVLDLAWADGVYLATGYVSPAVESQAGVLAAWTSSDGDAWTRIDPPNGGREICALEPNSAGGVVALGVEADRTMAWTWSEATGWSGGPLPDGPGHASPGADPFFGLCEIVPVAGRLVAVTGIGETTRSWTSIDGTSWAANAGFPAGSAQNVAAIGNTIVLHTVAHTPEGDATGTIHVGTVAP